MKNNDWKDRLNVVYSTNPDFNYDVFMSVIDNYSLEERAAAAAE